MLLRRVALGRAPGTIAGVTFLTRRLYMKRLLLSIWADDSANDLPEYAVAAAVFTAIAVVMKSLNIHGSDLLADMGINLGGVAR